MTKISSPAMLQWQLDRLTGQLMLVGDHYADQSCPCTYGYSDPTGKYVSESCIPKHLLSIYEYSTETVPMVDNEDLKGLLSQIAEEARGIRNTEMEKLCGKEVEQTDITEWARDKRKLIEPYTHELACAIPEGEKTGTLECCSYRMKPTGEVLLTCRKNGGVLEGLYPNLEDAQKEAAQFCGAATVDEALVKEVTKMFEENQIIRFAELEQEAQYILNKRYSPRTGITEIGIGFSFPKGVEAVIMEDQIDKKDQPIILSSIAELAKELGFEMRPEVDKRGKFRIRRGYEHIVFNLADWVGLDREGEPFLMPEEVMKQAIQESFAFAFTYKGKEVVAPAGSLIEPPKAKMPSKVKYTIKQVCAGKPPVCTFDIERKAETVETEFAKNEPELLAKLPAIIRANVSNLRGDDVIEAIKATKMRELEAPMKLLTKEIRDKLPPLYSQEKIQDPMVWVKFFTPDSSWTWYATEFDGDDTFFGWVVGHEKELGYFSLKELESARGPLGLAIERDRWFRPMPLSEVKKLHQEMGELAQGTVAAIGSAAITGIGIGAGFKFVDWVFSKFGKKKLGEGEMTEKPKIGVWLSFGIKGSYPSMIDSLRADSWAEMFDKINERLEHYCSHKDACWQLMRVRLWDESMLEQAEVKELKEGEMANMEQFCLSGDAWFELQDAISKGEKQKAMEIMWSKGIKLVLAPMTEMGEKQLKTVSRPVYSKLRKLQTDLVNAISRAEWTEAYYAASDLKNLLDQLRYGTVSEGEVATYARQLPTYVDVFKTTIAKHYRPTEDFHEGSIRTLKPEPNILVTIGCLRGDEWDAEAERCSPNPTVVKTIVPNNKKYREELDHLKLVHPEIKVNYRSKEVGVEPVVSEPKGKLPKDVTKRTFADGIYYAYDHTTDKSAAIKRAEGYQAKGYKTKITKDPGGGWIIWLDEASFLALFKASEEQKELKAVDEALDHAEEVE